MVDAAFRDQIERARAGDERAYEAIWRRFNPRLVRYLRAMAGPHEAEDLASITWIEVVRSLQRFDGGPDEFRAWIFSIARLRMLDLRRLQSRRPRSVAVDGWDEVAEVGGAEDPAAIAVREESTEAALAFIATLPKDQADILLLRIVAGLDVAAVAEVVGKRPGTVRVSMHRALKKLATHMAFSEVPGNARGSHGA
jgi:RNA polymerase sigma-70 factor (ECF subfamily)